MYREKKYILDTEKNVQFDKNNNVIDIINDQINTKTMIYNFLLFAKSTM